MAVSIYSQAGEKASKTRKQFLALDVLLGKADPQEVHSSERRSSDGLTPGRAAYVTKLASARGISRGEALNLYLQEQDVIDRAFRAVTKHGFEFSREQIAARIRKGDLTLEDVVQLESLI